jgi:hypothetical protein
MYFMTRCTKQVLSIECMICQPIVPCFVLEERHVWGASTHVGEVKYVQLILELVKYFFIKWLGE